MNTWIRSLTILFAVFYFIAGLHSEEVVVSSASAPVKIRDATIAEVKQGDRFQVWDRVGAWVAIEVSTEVGTQRGWVHSNFLQTRLDADALAPDESMAIAPGIAVEFDLIQVVVQGSRSHLTLQVTLRNLSNSTLAFDATDFRLVFDSNEIEPQGPAESSPNYYYDQMVLGFDSNAAIRTKSAQPQEYLSSGELPPKETIQKWLRFQLPSLPRDVNVSEFEILLRGKIGAAPFESDLKKIAVQGLQMQVRPSEMHPSVKVIEVHDGLNALNFSELYDMVDPDIEGGPQFIVLAKGPSFYMDRSVLNRLSGQFYASNRQPNPFLFVVAANATMQTNAAGTSSNPTQNLAFVASELEAALRILGERSDTSETLITHLSHSDPNIRVTSAAMLARQSGKDSVREALISAASDDFSEVRAAAIGALVGSANQYDPRSGVVIGGWRSGPIAPETVAAVLKAMKDPEYPVRYSAITAASRIHDPRIVQALVDQLQDDNESVVNVVCASLGALKAESAVGALEDLRRSEKRPLAAAAIRALQAMEKITELDTATAQLTEGVPNYNDFRLLKTSADSGAVEPLIAYLQNMENNQQFGEQAVEILGQLKDIRATPVLIEQLQYGNQYSEIIPRALGQLGDETAIEPLRKASRHSNMNSGRRAAIYGALLQLDDPEIFEHLVKLLSDPDSERSVYQLLPILGHAKNPLAGRLVARYLDDANNHRTAAQALLEQGTPTALKMLERKLLAEDYAYGSSLLSSIYSSSNPAKLEMLYVASKSENTETQKTASNFRNQIERAFRHPEHERLVGKPHIPFSAENWVNGSPLTAEDLKGKVVLLEFWSVWCDPCLTKFATLRKWQDMYGPDGLVVIGLTQYYGYGWDSEVKGPFRMSKHSPKNEAEALADFARYHRIGHRLAFLSPDRDVSSEYFVSAMPQSVLIDRAGVIRMIRSGNNENFNKEIEDQISRSLYEFNLETTSELSELRSAAVFKQINLQGSGISDEGLLQLQASNSLISLRLDNSLVSDQGLKTLASKVSLPALKELGLSKTRISNDGLKHLATFPELESLHIAAKGITDEGLKNLTQLKTIRKLSLGDGWSSASVSDKGLEHLAAMPNLEELELNGIQLSDEAIITLQDLPAIKSIGLMGTKITSNGLRRLRNARPELSIRVEQWSDWLSDEAYQKHFIEMSKQNYFPLEVEGKNTDHGPRYRGRFFPKPTEREFTSFSMHGNSPEQFAARLKLTTSRNLASASLTEFRTPDGEMKYSGTWVSTPFEAYWNTRLIEVNRLVDAARESYLLGNHSAALKSLEKAIDTQSDNLPGRMLLGNVQHALENEDAASQAFARVVDLIQKTPEEERLPSEWGFLGQALYRLNRFDEARTALQQEISMRRESSPTTKAGPRWWYLTMALHQLDEREQALEIFRTLSSQIDESSSSTQRNLRDEANALLGID